MVDWDQRYSRKTYVYGEAPSPVVDEAVAAGWLPPPPCRVLLLGEGEGRNAVALAARGYACVALDPSAAGLAKCAALAKKRGVDVDRVTSTAGVALARGGLGLFDAVVSVYCAYASGDERREAHALVARCLWPGGVYVYVGFGDNHDAVVAAAEAKGARRVAGCGGDRAAGPATVARELAGFETVAAREREEVLAEGAFHRGAASIAVYAGRVASTYAAAVASAFDASYPAAPGAAAGGDARLAAAGFLVGRAVHHANRSDWCRSCWRAACACAPAPAPAPSTLRVVVVVHPTEFLRPTSTARVLAGLGAATLLVYGCPAHDRQLDALLAAEDVALLFPEDGADGPAALGGARRPVVLVPDCVQINQ